MREFWNLGLNEHYGYRDKHDYMKINTSWVLIVNFNIPSEKRYELMELGYLQTLDYFKNFLGNYIFKL